MPRGVKNAKPTHLKVIQGTFRPDQAPKKEIAPPPVSSSDAPADLDEYARRAWDEYAQLLRRLGLFTEADRQAFRILCLAVSRFERAWARLSGLFQKETATAEDIRRAEVSVERAEHSVRQLWTEFGMTPAARSRLEVWAPPTEEDELHALMDAKRKRS